MNYLKLSSTNNLKNRSILLLNKIQLYGGDKLENLNKLIRKELKSERTKKIIPYLPLGIVVLFHGWKGLNGAPNGSVL